MITASYIRYPLRFFRPAGTSRGVLYDKETWFVTLIAENGNKGIGEVSFIPGLSIEDPARIENHLERICQGISLGEMDPLSVSPELPGIKFAMETAYTDLETQGNRILFPTGFTEGKAGIPINGLIWMGPSSYLKEQIKDKMDSGFRVLKLKIGNIDIQDELQLMKWIRSEYKSDDLELRLDANGAWTMEEAPQRMAAFAKFNIHSIEQPIQAGQIDEMAELCDESAIPIALDEELIGIFNVGDRRQILKKINPSYIILKPGLLGGFSEAKTWIDIAEDTGTGWWITSALESNIGLNAIAQWTGALGTGMPQGLGTGNLYRNNIPSPLDQVGDKLWYRPERKWEISEIT